MIKKIKKEGRKGVINVKTTHAHTSVCEKEEIKKLGMKTNIRTRRKNEFYTPTVTLFFFVFILPTVLLLFRISSLLRSLSHTHTHVRVRYL